MTLNMIPKTLIAVAALAVVATVTANAQPSMRATIPFSFHAGAQMMPAGEYDIAAGPSEHWIVVASRDGKISSRVPIVFAQERPLTGDCTLAFNQYGSSYFLNQVRTVNGYTIQAPNSKAEKEAAQADSRSVALVPASVVGRKR
jgi:hypothetical protein